VQAAPGAPPTSAAMAEPQQQPKPVPALRIAFGSCNDLTKPQVLWEPIAGLSPDAFVWLGDIIYADTEDIGKMRTLYEELSTYPAHAQLAKRTRVVGTWDDHDYGRDNAGREYRKRAESQQALLDFLGEPHDSARRSQEGVYTSVDLGVDPHRVRVILLDTRYHRDKPSPAGDVLGEAQWAWLQAQLQDSTAAVHLLVSSIQLVPEQHGFEKWGNFPSAKRRLLALLDSTKPSNLFVLSGDRHFGELSKLDRGPGHAAIYDLTSSSLSRPFGRAPEEENRYRIGATVWDVNFGVVEIDWQAQQVRLQLRGAEGTLALEQMIALEPQVALETQVIALEPKEAP
jgi:alkaline phosphatase D